MALPGLDVLLSGGQGGISVPSSAYSSTGPVDQGGFYFAPKSSTLPPVAWIAIAAAALLALIVYTRKGRA